MYELSQNEYDKSILPNELMFTFSPWKQIQRTKKLAIPFHYAETNNEGWRYEVFASIVIWHLVEIANSVAV